MHHGQDRGEQKDVNYAKKICGNGREIYKFCGNMKEIYKFCGNGGICNMHHWLKGDGCLLVSGRFDALYRRVAGSNSTLAAT